MTASLTCDTDLQFTLVNYLRRKHDKPMINVHIVWICKATSVISHLQIYTILLLCSSSVFEYNAVPVTHYDPVSSCVPTVPFFLLLTSFLMILTHPFQTCRLILCCCFCTNSLQLSSQHPQTH